MYVNINSITIFKTVLSLFVDLLLIPNHLLNFLHCPLFDYKKIALLSTLSKFDCKLIEMKESTLTKTLLFGKSLFDLKKNFLILNVSIDNILSIKRFEELLL